MSLKWASLCCWLKPLQQSFSWWGMAGMMSSCLQSCSSLSFSLGHSLWILVSMTERHSEPLWEQAEGWSGLQEQGPDPPVAATCSCLCTPYAFCHRELLPRAIRRRGRGWKREGSNSRGFMFKPSWFLPLENVALCFPNFQIKTNPFIL